MPKPKKLSLDERARLDHLLLTSDVTFCNLAVRFDVTPSFVQKRSRALGLVTVQQNRSVHVSIRQRRNDEV